ncbi:MAG: cell envelope integrity EipB family protein [Pseudomonadota bacterium]
MKFIYAWAICLLGQIAALSAAYGSNSASSITLAPHQAVYDISLNELRSGTGVSQLRGRLVFEMTGSVCEGYTVNMRFVTRITDLQGSEKVTDLRASSWEHGKSNLFRFNSSHYLNQKLDQATSGDARRINNKAAVEIRLKQPKPTKLKTSPNVMFPTQHIVRIIESALAGKTHLHADVYDGSELGEKVYQTTTIIGKKVTSSNNKNTGKIKNINKLRDLKSWPVAISYFSPDRERSIPDYQIGFRLFANGVSRNLLIDYGDFSIKGALKTIKFHEPAECKTSE